MPVDGGLALTDQVMVQDSNQTPTDTMVADGTARARWVHLQSPDPAAIDTKPDGI